ncbi:ATP-binding protein [Streptomyces guryensis]|uniref:ATP-binding protein n=1 Tax=Streptomyces guryensis TaxID=2886947 RepID=UPI0027DFCACB|nr:ATP-binding protein [Streptomyces guryensis]
MDTVQDNDQLKDQPLEAMSEAYEGSPRDPARARRTAGAFLTRLQSVHRLVMPDHTLDTVQLVVSELVTNACKYASGPCLLRLELTGDRVEMSVWDSDPVLPVAMATDPHRAGQHGLEIVVAVCQTFEVRREPVGKRITATVMLAADTGDRPADHSAAGGSGTPLGGLPSLADCPELLVSRGEHHGVAPR